MKKLIFLFLGLTLFLLIISLFIASKSFADTSTKFAGTGAGTNWISPTNIYADDNNDTFYANGLSVSTALKATNFSFAIPTGATIDNMQVIMGRYSTMGAVIDNSVRWTKDNTATVGSDIDSGATWNANTEQQDTLSGLGGVSWTAADINSSNFGVWIVSEGQTGDSESNIDYVKITVSYTSVTTSTITLSAASSVATSTATLNGNVTATGGENPTVTMYWGTTDGGQTPANWTSSSTPTSPSQPQGVAAFYKSATDLSPGTTYYFSAKATNSAGTSWPAASLSFTTTTVCGNGIIETGEQCDGSNLGGTSCTSLGYNTGSLSCTASCTFNTSNCSTGGGGDTYYTLAVSRSGTGSGTITSNPSGINCGIACSINLLLNTLVTLITFPSPGSNFVGWLGDCSGVTSTCAVIMNSNKSVTATFDILPAESRIITVLRSGTGSGTITSNPAGIDCGILCRLTLLQNASTTLTAFSSPDSIFVGWSGDCNGTTSTCVLVMDNDKSVTAIFNILPATKWCELEEKYIPELNWTEEKCYKWCEKESSYILPANWSESRCVPSAITTKWCELKKRDIPENEWSNERCIAGASGGSEIIKWCEVEKKDLPESEWSESRCVSSTPAATTTATTTPSSQQIIRTAKGVVAKTVERTKEFVESSVGSKVTKTVSAVGLVVGGTNIASGFLFFPSFTEWSLFFLRLLGVAMTGLGLKKRIKPWGTTYDSVTKQPLDPAYVVLQDLQGKEVASSITDLDGRYGFLLEPGKYKMVVKKTNYKFPSQKLSRKTHDELYNDLYFGEEIEIKKAGEAIIKNIPLDPEKFDWNEFTKKNKNRLRFYSHFELFWRRLTDLFFVLGFFAAIIAVIFVPYPLNFIISGLYVFLLILKRVAFKPKTYGSIFEKQSGFPLSFAIIRVFSVELQKEILKRVADRYGRYYILIPNGRYYVKIERKNEDASYTEIFTSRVINVQKGIIRERFVI